MKHVGTINNKMETVIMENLMEKNMEHSMEKNMETSIVTIRMKTQMEKNMENTDTGVTLMVWPLCVFVNQRLLILCLISGQVCGTT